jgi:hypothetical protein
MKFASSILLALGAISGVSGFAPIAGQTSSTTALKSSYAPGEASWQMPPAAGPSGDFFPLDIPMKRIEGGGTVRTWDIPPETERLQYVVETNGRPLKAKVEL